MNKHLLSAYRPGFINSHQPNNESKGNQNCNTQKFSTTLVNDISSFPTSKLHHYLQAHKKNKIKWNSLRNAIELGIQQKN